MKKLTDEQKDALMWFYKNGHRRWFTHIGGHDPAMSTLMALVRNGLATKKGGDGVPASLALTTEGLLARAAIETQERTDV